MGYILKEKELLETLHRRDDRADEEGGGGRGPPRSRLTVLLPVRGTGTTGDGEGGADDGGPLDAAGLHSGHRSAPRRGHRVPDGAAHRRSRRRRRPAGGPESCAPLPGRGYDPGGARPDALRLARAPLPGEVEGWLTPTHRRPHQASPLAVPASRQRRDTGLGSGHRRPEPL